MSARGKITLHERLMDDWSLLLASFIHVMSVYVSSSRDLAGLPRDKGVHTIEAHQTVAVGSTERRGPILFGFCPFLLVGKNNDRTLHSRGTRKHGVWGLLLLNVWVFCFPKNVILTLRKNSSTIHCQQYTMCHCSIS